MRGKMGKYILIFLFTVFIALSCKKDKEEEISPLKGNWVLTDIQSTQTNALTNFPIDINDKIVIEFSSPSDTILFRGICNNGAGTYLYNPSIGELKVKDLIVTKVLCTNIEWETFSVLNLNKAYKCDINGDTLKIYSLGDYNLIFKRE